MLRFENLDAQNAAEDFKTETIHNSKRPEWGACYEFDGGRMSAPEARFIFNIWEDGIFSDKIIGTCNTTYDPQQSGSYWLEP
eukprot:6557288-Prymnesium_polylepis.1